MIPSSQMLRAQANETAAMLEAEAQDVTSHTRHLKENNHEI